MKKENSTVHDGLQLLASGYEHGFILLDLYGEIGIDGIDLHDITLMGDKRSIAGLLSADEMDEMELWCERQAKIAGDESRLDGAISRAEGDADCQQEQA